MKFIKYCLVAVLGLLMLTTSVQAASFTDKQIQDHVCLNKTALPWRISPVKPADVPEAYKAWGNLWSGYWNSQVCHTLVIEKITAEGKVDLIYSTGQPAFEYGKLTGVIVQEGENQELHVRTDGGKEVTYTLILGFSPMLRGLFAGHSPSIFVPVLADDN